MKTSKNIHKLRGINKWCLSGTPFGTSIYDIYNQLKFVGLAGDNLNKLELKKIHQNKIFNGCGSFRKSKMCKSIMFTMKMLVMRHKKNQKFNGEQKLGIEMVEKEENEIFIDFTDKQRKYYDILYETAKETYSYYKLTRNVGRGTIDILSSLRPSRQSCSAQNILFNKKEIEEKYENVQAKTSRIRQQIISNKSKYVTATNEAFNNSEDAECPICYECPFDEPLQTPCRHIFCGDCIRSVLIEKPECPICRKKVTPKQLQKPPNFEKKEVQKKENEIIDNDLFIRFDAKLNVLINKLKQIKENKPSDKSLVFTSFSKSLDWICNELKKNGLEYRTLTGSMSKNKRKKQFDEFTNNRNVKVFVLTVRTGAVGITLTAANHVFMLEPCINPSLHRQAINRVYRLGQKKKVFIRTLIMKDSIEQRIWNINKTKENGMFSDDIYNDNKNGKKKHYEISKFFE